MRFAYKINRYVILMILLCISNFIIAQATLGLTAGNTPKEYTALVRNGFALKSLRDIDRDLTYAFTNATVQNGGYIEVELLVNDKKQLFKTKLTSTGGTPEAETLSTIWRSKKDNVKDQAYYIKMGDIVEESCKNAKVKVSTGWRFFLDIHFNLGDMSETLLQGALGKLHQNFENGDQNDHTYDHCYSKYLDSNTNLDIRIKIKIKNATLDDFRFPDIWADGIDPLAHLDNEFQLYREVKKLKVIVLESPNETKEASYYKNEMQRAITEANKYFTNKTGNTPGSEITAEVGNPRLFFKNVDLIIKKGSREKYPKDGDSAPQLVADANTGANDDETMQLVYVHSIQIQRNGAPWISRGFSTADFDQTPKNSDYTAFSYSRLFNDDPATFGPHEATIVHEFGHYYNLLHPFQGGCNSSGGGDHVNDTPPASGALWYLKKNAANTDVLIPLQGIDNACNNAPRCHNTSRRQIENIMDYGPCRWMFTKGQVTRMQAQMANKPSLFHLVHSSSNGDININEVTINVHDQRHTEARRKRDINNNETNDSLFSLKYITPKIKGENGVVEIISPKEEQGTIVIYDINGAVIYRDQVSINKGENTIQILKPVTFDGKLNILKFHSNERIETMKIFNEF